jgi:hypothetical protein
VDVVMMQLIMEQGIMVEAIVVQITRVDILMMQLLMMDIVMMQLIREQLNMVQIIVVEQVGRVVIGWLGRVDVLVLGEEFLDLGVVRMEVSGRRGFLDGRRGFRGHRNGRLWIRFRCRQGQDGGALNGGGREEGLRRRSRFRTSRFSRRRGRCVKIVAGFIGLFGNHIAGSRVLLQGAELFSGQRPGTIVDCGA